MWNISISLKSLGISGFPNPILYFQNIDIADAIIDSVGVLVFINLITVRLPEFISNIPSELRLDNDETNQLRQRDPINDDALGVILIVCKTETVNEK